jgi:hypothetical protein
MGTYLNRTFSGANTSRKIFTLSFWVKRSTFGSMKAVISAETTSNFYDQILFTSGDQFEINNVASGGDVIQYKTNSVFRDPSAWYHVVAAIDTTQASASNGIKIYINGVLQTSLASTTYAQNATFEIGRDGSTTSIGRRQRDTDGYGVGYLSDFHYIDGQQKVATDFGQTDSTTGIWKPKTYSGTYGNNGFRLEFKNAAALGTDTSGNSETFTVNNADTTNQVVDTPSNNFATLNPIAGAYNNNTTIGQGALQNTTGGDNSQYFASMGVTKGKWCWEVKINSGDMAIGLFNKIPPVYIAMGDNDYSVMAMLYYSAGGSSGSVNRYQYNSTNYYNIPAGFGNDNSGTIYQFLLDLDSGTKTWIVRRAGDASTQGNYTLPSGFLNGNFIIPGYSVTSTWPATQQQWNFGNPSYSNSSSNADANGYGDFEYAVPSGYYALCTENINQYG